MFVRELLTRLAYQTDDQGARDYEARLESIKRRVAQVTAAIAGFGTLVALAGDAMNRSLAQIEGAVGRSATSGQEAADVYERLYEISTRTGVGANESAQAFTRFNMAMRDLNRPAQDTIDLIEGLQASAIVAGVSTTDLTGTMIQLGQALASGRLQGDEMMKLRETMPGFLREVSQEMGVTLAQFMEMSTKGQLTPARLIPAMLAASRTARAELSRFPMTMDRSFLILRNTTQRWLADFDRALGLSRLISRFFVYIAQAMDRWRANLTTVERWVTRLGGLEQIFRAAAGTLAVLVAGIVAFRAAAIAAAIAQYIWLAPWILLAAAIVALGVLLADFVSWVSGEDVDTLFGSWFGDFDTFIQPFRQVWIDLKDWISAIWGAIAAEFDRFLNSEQTAETIRVFNAAAGLIMQAWAPVKNFFIDLWNSITSAFTTAWEAIQPIIDAIRRAMAWMEDPLGRRSSAPGGGSPAGPAGAVAGGAALGGVGETPTVVVPTPPATTPGPARPRVSQGISGALRRMAEQNNNPSAGLDERMPATPQVNAVQNNDITIEQVIQATGNNPAEIAAAARTGVSNASGQIGQTQEAFGRAIAGANSRVEPAAQ